MAVSSCSISRPVAAILYFVAALCFFSVITVHGHGHVHEHGSDSGSGGCPFSSSSSSGDHHHHPHEHDHSEHHHDHHLHRGGQSDARQRRKLPEELAEEEDMKLERAHDSDHHHHDDHSHSPALGFSSPMGLWLSAMGCSLLVSLASLICLVLLPVLFLKGTPPKELVDCLATFGAGAMLGDAFLHQLPHAFGGEDSHSHDHSAHVHEHGSGHSHAHSLKDLSVGLSILFGIVLFLLVEKLVRYVEAFSGSGGAGLGHHHHHGHGKVSKLKADDDAGTKSNLGSTGIDSNTADGNPLDADDSLNDKRQVEGTARLRKRVPGGGADGRIEQSDASVSDESSHIVEPPASHPSSLVFGYLNLFSDGVHNFTDGMALGSAFLLYGSVGGWSRTLFLLAHELPQEIGDFGILVRSGFTVPKALFFNFLSALVALAGTALALLLGKEPGNSSLIEGFTAGGFIYIAVAGVLPEINSGSTTFKSTVAQLTSLLLGMGVALYISLVE